jgi:copper chaperone CopZ
MKTIYFIFLSVMLLSCNETSEKSVPVSIKKSKHVIVHANCQADFTVEGMVCQMGCGGSIRKELKMTGAVERVEVNFIEEQKEQVVHVSYDSTLINTTKMTTLLNAMNDRQFTAKLISKNRYNGIVLSRDGGGKAPGDFTWPFWFFG